MKPNLSTKYYGGFWMPYSGIAPPFKVTIAFAENAAANGKGRHCDIRPPYKPRYGEGPHRYQCRRRMVG